jgi:uncharacterized protein (DUF885 family)
MSDAPSPDFHALAEAAVEDLLRLRPESATGLGDHRYDDRLDDWSPAGLAEEARVLTRRRDELDSLDLDVLGVDDAVDADLLRHGLDRRLFGLEQLREHTWNPLVWLPGEAVWSIVARDTTPAADRLRALASRLEQVPDRMDLARTTLEAMPAVHLETAVGQAAGAAALIRDEVSRLLEEEPSLKALMEPAQERAARAVEDYRTWLTEQEGTRDPRLGSDLFAAKLHLVLDADLSAQQVVDAARAHLEETTAELERLSRDWTGTPGPEGVREALARVAADAPDDSTIVDLARRTLEETTAAVREAGFVTIPDAECEIQVMPEFRRGVAIAYCDSPGPLEEGGTTYYAIAPTPSDWSAERVASFYREYNTAMITNLTVHEAMPGHVLQIAHARRHRAATRVRRVMSSGSFIEGWAVHAERLLVETGHGGLPVRLQQLKMQLRMTINALLDHGVHAGGMTEHEGLALMTESGFQEEGEAVGKWRRALLTSAQLSTYFVGYAELAPLLAGRTHFDEVLAHGNPPPRHLRVLLGA